MNFVPRRERRAERKAKASRDLHMDKVSAAHSGGMITDEEANDHVGIEGHYGNKRGPDWQGNMYNHNGLTDKEVHRNARLDK